MVLFGFDNIVKQRQFDLIINLKSDTCLTQW